MECERPMCRCVRLGRRDGMEPHEHHWIRLPLDCAYNVRELGGYPTSDGGCTRFHRFLRSDGLGRLTQRDQDFLRSYGVRAVLDLRDESEAADFPDVSLGPDVHYANIPLLGYNAAEIEELERNFTPETFSMEMVYQRMIENYEGIRACMRFLADAPDGCVLFHCAVGKDRTGIIAMVLLSLAGVDRWDVVSNYIQSRTNLMRDEAFAADWEDGTRSVFRDGMRSEPELIEFAYDLVDVDHGGIDTYLLECGVSDEEIAVVRTRLTGDIG